MTTPIPGQYEFSKLLAQLLIDQLGLNKNPDVPQVFIYNQKWEIPTVDGLFISIALLSEKIFGTSNRQYWSPQDNNGAGGMREEITQNVQETYTIDLFSRDASARQLRFQVVAALHSTEAQQLCEQYSFKIATQPTSFIDLSEVEASARLNRYQCTLNVLRSYLQDNAIAWFDKFNIPPNGKQLVVNP